MQSIPVTAKTSVHSNQPNRWFNTNRPKPTYSRLFRLPPEKLTLILAAALLSVLFGPHFVYAETNLPMDSARSIDSLGTPRISKPRIDLGKAGTLSPKFLDVDDAFKLDINTSDDQATLIWTIAPDHYLYKQKFVVAIEAESDDPTTTANEPAIQPNSKDQKVKLLSLTRQTSFSQGIRKNDDYFGPVEVYYHQAIGELSLNDIQRQLKQHRSPPYQLTIKYQGCAEAGLCYPVQTRRVTLWATNDGQ